MMIPSHPILFFNFANRFNAMLKVMVFPSTSWVFFMVSKTWSVNSSSPQISHAFTTVLKTERGGRSAVSPFSNKLTQSKRMAVALRDFSDLAQTAITFLRSPGLGVRERGAMSSRILTASFQLSSAIARSMERLWIRVDARWAALEEEQTSVSHLSVEDGSSDFLAAVSKRKPSAKLSMPSATMTPHASNVLPASACAIESNSYPAILAYDRTCSTNSPLVPSLLHLLTLCATWAKVPNNGVIPLSITIIPSISTHSSTSPSFPRAITTAS
mmetsp:Transcript_12631/g.15381  ORF Transcript_12631/g.15381 Transcript_12631/m.15381 type:complete len:271 (-) Transcript_12631:1102-1914(-)